MGNLPFLRTTALEAEWGGIYWENSEVKVKVAQSRPTLCNPMDYTVRGIL